ncbi:hypothetical protein CKAN_00942400 [Cinnamomum micranthum f. kanehirae]|uniref:Uncharacterized protein n=1 Tax=Cinnamomum micranthum f. kanehirae TaxID=337451 RepID=A0A443NQI6_9MAGN|nr:hypothetical protein CKAN_00942400 [Cinnamomum micranthum f. kanehirae]
METNLELLEGDCLRGTCDAHESLDYILLRWSLVKGGDIVRTPGLTFPNGLHIRLFPKNK